MPGWDQGVCVGEGSYQLYHVSNAEEGAVLPRKDGLYFPGEGRGAGGQNSSNPQSVIISK